MNVIWTCKALNNFSSKEWKKHFVKNISMWEQYLMIMVDDFCAVRSSVVVQ